MFVCLLFALLHRLVFVLFISIGDKEEDEKRTMTKKTREMTRRKTKTGHWRGRRQLRQRQRSQRTCRRGQKKKRRRTWKMKMKRTLGQKETQQHKINSHSLWLCEVQCFELNANNRVSMLTATSPELQHHYWQTDCLVWQKTRPNKVLAKLYANSRWPWLLVMVASVCASGKKKKYVTQNTTSV